jgi:hypothetical protein
MADLPLVICNEALRLILERVTWEGNDRFCRWVYPDLPTTYHLNGELADEIEAGMLEGKSALQIAKAIYMAHA